MKRIALLAALVLALGVSGAQAGGPRLILTGEGARDLVRSQGGHPHKCDRLSPSRIRCNATFWYARHEAEEEADGTLVNEVVTYFQEERVVVVGSTSQKRQPRGRVPSR